MLDFNYSVFPINMAKKNKLKYNIYKHCKNDECYDNDDEILKDI